MYAIATTADVFAQVIWGQLKDLGGGELKELADRLPATVLGSRADSTVKKYLGAFRRWKAWAHGKGMPVIPVKDVHWALYLQYLADSSQSKSAVEEACNAVSWVHSTAGLTSPMVSPFLKATLEGLQRLLAKPAVKKAPITPTMLDEMVKDAEESHSLSDLRLVTACLLAYAGFLRFNELVNVRPCDIKIQRDKLILLIPKSKTDQLRQGDELVITRTGNSTCLVAMLETYLARTGTQMSDHRFMFRPICKTARSETLRESGSISYTCLRESFRKKLKELGYNPDIFGLHSLRAGGATAAANNGVPDRLFKRHGRWKSDSAKDGYVEDLMEHRMEVTRQIGL